jgi:hypothetical protein
VAAVVAALVGQAQQELVAAVAAVMVATVLELLLLAQPTQAVVAAVLETVLQQDKMAVQELLSLNIQQQRQSVLAVV